MMAQEVQLTTDTAGSIYHPRGGPGTKPKPLAQATSISQALPEPL